MSKYFKGSVFIMLMVSVIISCSPTQSLETVEQVDLNRYTGKWYEIASLPAKFQKGCTCTTAEYKEHENYIKVYNRCYDTIKQEWRDATAKAFPVEDSGNARLQVQFFWPFKAPYYIIALDEDYQYAMVGSPSREYLWILSRRPQIDDAVYDSLVYRAHQLDFPVEHLQATSHQCNAERAY